MVDFIVGQSRRRLIENQELGVHIKGAADLQELFFAGFELRDHDGGIHIHTQVFKELPGAGDLFFLPKQAQRTLQLAAEKDVVGNGQIVDDIQFLVDKRDSGLLHLGDGRGRIIPAEKTDGTGVRRDDAGQNVHQGGFPGAVFTEKGVDFAFFHRKVDVRQGLGSAKGLGHMVHFKDRHDAVSLCRLRRTLWKGGCRGLPCIRERQIVCENQWPWKPSKSLTLLASTIQVG